MSAIKETFSLKRIIKELRYVKGKELALLLAMLIATVVAFVVSNDKSVMNWVSMLVGLVTAVNLILVDRGALTNYAWGTVSCVIWLIVALQNGLIGGISAQAFYLVMQFVGMIVWFKSMNDHDHVTPKRLTIKQGLLILIGVIVVYLLVVAVSIKASGNQIWLDATLLPLGIVGQILMTYGYSSQWFAWITLDIINVIIWTNQLQVGGVGALGMLALQIIMTINAFYGLYAWSKGNLGEAA